MNVESVVREVFYKKNGNVGRSSYISLFFLFSVLFLPTASFYFYYSVVLVFFVLVVIEGRGRFIWAKPELLIFVLFCCFVTIIAILRMGHFNNFEDLKELIKILLFVSIVMVGVRLSDSSICNLLALFLVLNTIVAFLQFFKLYYPGVGLITSLYNATHHIEMSLSYSSPRALGLSAGPGQQAVLNLFLFSFFLARFLNGNKIFNLLLCFFAVLGMGISQSKTALIAFLVGSVIISILLIIHMRWSAKLKVFLTFMLLAVIALLMSKEIAALLPEYSRLFEQRGNVTSFMARFTIWKEMSSVFFLENNFFMYLFGVGRSGLKYYGYSELPFDSDYMYVLINYGLVGFFCFVSLIIIFLIKSAYLFSSLSIYSRYMTFIVAYAAVVGLALNFFIEPRVHILTAVVIYKIFQYRREREYKGFQSFDR
jgi:hypothetical protein